MRVTANLQSDRFQAVFHARWSGLHDPHVRALAWLLDAPDLLDPAAAQWHGKIATLTVADDLAPWLAALDRAPDELHAYLALRPYERLGRYAEKLLAFYFARQGVLVAHGVQVQAGKNQTIGEFDYLLRHAGQLEHWEFATKLYLLEGSADGDYFVGPNLADTLGTKMRKILERQLALGRHPDAQVHLPAPIDRACALIKGWLFYHGNDQPAQALGVRPDHCRGFWCAQAEAGQLAADGFMVLPRLSWLAPLQVGLDQPLNKAEMISALAAHFAQNPMPVLVSLLHAANGFAQEFSRGFIVPDDWRERAGQRAQRAFIASHRDD
ncbi:DUF1853 family protein [Actimicrobium sp. CCC2.4]|uniref:DUF1853 family protein n=1 Tax=Actimicrobium sp. CCC2.4 TaxID=3048606 RepID=UPI002AC8F929|nr:DUF1853 family protein [Actimicrobium sp. CCC2.4]MEB0133889.1 DUF1853 family protein [Actimicrobium sp. CCC2.4]WPX31430.1 DUF1853 family protein [Actimicrobium sp. CCC2.4]